MLGKGFTVLCATSALLLASNAAIANECTVWGELTSNAQTQITTMKTPQASMFSLHGQLIRRPLLSDDTTQWTGYQLYHAEAKINHDLALTHEYAVPFAVKTSKVSGEVLEYHFNAKLEAAEQQKLIALYRAFHIAKQPHNQAGAQYLVEEQDDLGKYTAKYSLGQHNTLKRERLNYTQLGKENQPLSSGMLQITQANIVRDEFNFAKDKCWFVDVSGVSHVTALSKDKNLAIDVAQSLKLKRNQAPLPTDARLLQLGDDPKQWANLNYAFVYPKPPAKPLATQKAFMHALKGLDLKTSNRDAIYRFLHNNDSYIPSLKEALAAGSLDDKLESKLLMYLGKHDSVNAQRLLVEIVTEGDQFTPQQRFRSLMAMRYSEQPMSENLVDALFNFAMSEQQGHSKQLSHTTLMIVGAMAKNQAGSDYANTLTQRLADNLRASNDEAKSAALIAALGNSNNTQYQADVGSYLQGPSARLRAEAAQALAKMPNKTSLNYLQSQLDNESNVKAQSEILKAMGKNQLDQTQLNTIYHYASSSREREVRSAAITALSDQASTNQAAKASLQQLLKSETNQKNLHQLMKALHGESE